MNERLGLYRSQSAHDRLALERLPLWANGDLQRLRGHDMVKAGIAQTGPFLVPQRDPGSSPKECAILLLVFFPYAPRHPRAIARGRTRIAPWLISGIIFECNR